MRTVTRANVLSISLLCCLSFGLGACGKTDSKPAPTDHATHAAPTTPVEPKAPAIPDDASIEDFCAAVSGEGADLSNINTIGAAADTFEKILAGQSKTGTPAEMSADVRKQYLEHLDMGDEFVADLRKLPADGSPMLMQSDKEFFAKWGGNLKNPPGVTDYVTKTC